MQDQLHGLIVREQSGFFRVEVDDSGEIVICRLRGRLMEEAQSSDIAAIGDRVQISMNDDGSGSIELVEPRKSALSRAVRTEGSRGAGGAEREQVIIANADQVIFVFAAASPAPKTRTLDRFLVAGEKSGISNLVIVINKIDLEDPSVIQTQFAPYEKIGYQVVYTSARNGDAVDVFRNLLKDKISAVTGPSGVGKTSLLNSVQAGLGRAVKDVGSTSKGMHTTRDSELVKLDVGGYLADTPGVRSFGIWDVEPEELDAYYIDIAPYIPNCRFGDCTHANEPGCEVRAAVERGDVHPTRYDSYLRLREEIEETYEKNSY